MRGFRSQSAEVYRNLENEWRFESSGFPPGVTQNV
jgi:hypothetical protein